MTEIEFGRPMSNVEMVNAFPVTEGVCEALARNAKMEALLWIVRNAHAFKPEALAEEFAAHFGLEARK